MDRSDAIKLIKGGVNSSQTGEWADLGCGSGTFTLALASLLPEKSKIYALDKDAGVLASLPENHEGVILNKIHQNFKDVNYPFKTLDGVVMANSLHYVRKKLEFLTRLRNYINDQGKLVVVEYEARIPNPWVPFPVNKKDLSTILLDAGYHDIRFLHQMNSIYGHIIYSLTASKQA